MQSLQVQLQLRTCRLQSVRLAIVDGRADQRCGQKGPHFAQFRRLFGEGGQIDPKYISARLRYRSSRKRGSAGHQDRMALDWSEGGKGWQRVWIANGVCASRSLRPAIGPSRRLFILALMLLLAHGSADCDSWAAVIPSRSLTRSRKGWKGLRFFPENWQAELKQGSRV
jgi:hypothetical protein